VVDHADIADVSNPIEELRTVALVPLQAEGSCARAEVVSSTADARRLALLAWIGLCSAAARALTQASLARRPALL
jgi:hypothetical protein